MLKLIVAAASLAAAFLAPLLSAEGSVIILDYHTFLENNTSTLNYSVKELNTHLDRMHRLGYKFVSLQDAMAGKVEGKANIVITIDDGNHTVYPTVKSVFEPRGIKPYLFVYAGIINQRRLAIKSSQLLELMQDGCGVGAHGWFHEYMTPTAWKKNPAKVLKEASNSGPSLAKIIGQQPKLFAYPFGVDCPEARAALVKAGYEWLFLADTEITPVNFSNPSLNKLAIKRTLTFKWNSRKLFKALEDNLK